MLVPFTDRTRDQVELIAADYFATIEAEFKREGKNKAEHNRRLQNATGDVSRIHGASQICGRGPSLLVSAGSM